MIILLIVVMIYKFRYYIIYIFKYKNIKNIKINLIMFVHDNSINIYYFKSTIIDKSIKINFT